MLSERWLTVESGLALFGSHLLATNVVVPWLARWLPALALDRTERVLIPSFSSLRVTPVGYDLTDPGLWVYLGVV